LRRHRYQLEIDGGAYDCDDYLIRQFGVECYSVIDGEKDNFIIYAPIIAIHDFDPKIDSLDAFQEMKKEMLQRQHEDWERAAEQQREQLTKLPASDVDVI